MNYSEQIRTTYLQLAEEEWKDSDNCGDPSCIYCGYICPQCDTPHGYVQHLEKLLDQFNDLVEKTR